MKAVVFDRYGGPEVLRLVELRTPTLGRGELLIAAQATDVNPADWRLRCGQFKLGMRLKLPFTPGNDVAGRIIQKSDDVTDFAVGDPVYAMTPLRDGGCAAEFVAIDARLVARAPTAISLAESAVLPLAGLTALQALRDQGRLQRGESLLVAGASGGVGHFAVQIGKALGAHVSGLCGSRSFDFVRSLGADEVYDYADPASYYGPRRFDLVFDTVAKESFFRWRHLLRAGGTIVTVNPVIGKILPHFMTSLWGIAHVRSFFVRPGRADLVALSRLVNDGTVKPSIQARFPLDNIADAHRLSANGHVRGKILITLKDG